MATKTVVLPSDLQKKKDTLAKIQSRISAGDLSITSAGAKKAVQTGVIPGSKLQNEMDAITQASRSGQAPAFYQGGVEAQARKNLAAGTPSQITSNQQQAGVTPTTGTVATSTTPSQGTFFVRDGKVYERIGDTLINPYMNMKDTDRVLAEREYITKYGLPEDLAKFEAEQMGIEYLTPEQQTKAKKTRLEQEVEAAKKQAELKKQQEEATYNKQQEMFAREESATKTGLVSGREGLQANAPIGQAITAGFQTQTDELNRVYQSTQLAMEETARQLEYYKQSGQTELAEQEANRLLKLQQKADTAKKNLLEESSKTNLQNIDTLTKISSLPSAVLSQFTEESLNKFVGGNLDSAFTTALLSNAKELDLAQKELAKDPNNIEKQNRVFALQGKTDQIIIEDYKKKANFINGIQSLVGLPTDKGGLTQEQADAILQKEGYMDKPLTPIEQQSKLLDLRIKQTQDATERAKLLKEQSNLSQLNNIYGTGENNIINKISTFTVGQTPDTRDKNNPYYGQCAAVTNDVLGMPGFFGSTWESKISKRNKGADEIPNIGDVFISSVGNAEVGHVGFVKDVTLDQKGNILVTLADSNRNDDLKWNERTVTLDQLKTDEKVVGYYSPVNASQTGVNSPTQLESQVRAFAQQKIGGGDKDSRLQLEKDLMNEIKSGRASNPAEAKKNLGIVTKEDQEVKDQVKNSLSSSSQAIKDYQEISRQYKTAQTLTEGKSGIQDLALIVSFLKQIDPGSVARESEVGAVESARSLYDDLLLKAQKITSGKKLSKDQRQEILSSMDALKTAADEAQYERLLKGRQRIEDRGVENTIVDENEIKKLERQLGDKALQIQKDLGIKVNAAQEQEETPTYSSPSDIRNKGQSASSPSGKFKFN